MARKKKNKILTGKELDDYINNTVVFGYRVADILCIAEFYMIKGISPELLEETSNAFARGYNEACEKFLEHKKVVLKQFQENDNMIKSPDMEIKYGKKND